MAIDRMSAPTPPRDCLYFFERGFIFTSARNRSDDTRRIPAVLLLTADGGDFGLSLDGGAGDGPSPPATSRANCVALAPFVSRSLDARGCRLLSVHVEPSHPLYRAFRALGTASARLLDRRRFAPLDAAMSDCFHGRLAPSRAGELFDAILAAAAPCLPSMPPRDPRIEAAIECLQAAPELSLAALTRAFGLSYDRLSHLFSDQVGLPLKTYHLWRKVKRAGLALGGDLSLTEIAHEAGFADSAHLTRTFARFFRLRPSYLTDSDCVQVFAPAPAPTSLPAPAHPGRA